MRGRIKVRGKRMEVRGKLILRMMAKEVSHLPTKDEHPAPSPRLKSRSNQTIHQRDRVATQTKRLSPI